MKTSSFEVGCSFSFSLNHYQKLKPNAPLLILTVSCFLAKCFYNTFAYSIIEYPVWGGANAKVGSVVRSWSVVFE